MYSYQVLVLILCYSASTFGWTKPSSCSHDRECFCSLANCAVSRQNTFDLKSAVSCTDCTNLCRETLGNSGSSSRCTVAVYEYASQRCFLYSAQRYRLVEYSRPQRDCFTPKRSCRPIATPAPTTAPPVSPCPPGQEPRYIAVQNMKLSSRNNAATLTGTTLEQCIQSCSNQKLPNGNNIVCKSFEFTNQQCLLSADAAQPAGSGTLQTSTDTTYYELACFDSNLVKGCGLIIEKWPHYVLIGHVRAQVEATNEQDCIIQCMTSQQSLGFRCVSGMFYFDVNNEPNCLLNTETRLTRPDAFIPNNLGGNEDYFQWDCNNASIQRLFVNSNRVSKKAPSDAEVQQKLMADVEAKAALNTWTDWSPCLLNTGTQLRYKRCLKRDVRRCPKQELQCVEQDLNALLQQDPANNITDLKTTTTTTVSSSNSVASDLGNSVGKCQCLIDENGKRRCDVGVQVIVENGVTKKRYCTNPKT